jgi:superoxide dismutase, Cu-Zn family
MMDKLVLIAFIPLLAACAPGQPVETGTVSAAAEAMLIRSDGSAAGVATLTQRSDGLWLSVSADAPGTGTYGMHVHSVGRCEGPGFETAGSHWNPANRQHGHDNPMGAHAGDLANVTANSEGKLITATPLKGVMLSGAGGVLDADGASIVIHEKADDYKTDPSGNSGKRLICGVFSQR